MRDKNTANTNEGDFSNEDLLKFFGDIPEQELGQKICFALFKNKRHFLNIASLCDLKQQYPSGIDALQLFKIPTRHFQQYFYYHDMKWMGKMYKHSFSKLRHDV